MAVDNAVDTYVSCRSIGRNTTKVFDYIQPEPQQRALQPALSNIAPPA